MTDYTEATTASDVLDQDGDAPVRWWFKLWLANWSTFQAKSKKMDGINFDHVFSVNIVRVLPLYVVSGQPFLGADANFLRIVAKIGSRGSRVECRSTRG